jgi:hypothetical protein
MEGQGRRCGGEVVTGMGERFIGLNKVERKIFYGRTM